MASVLRAAVPRSELTPIARRSQVVLGISVLNLILVLASAGVVSWWYGSQPGVITVAVLTPLTLPPAIYSLVLARRNRTDAGMLLASLVVWAGALATLLFGWRFFAWTELLALSPVLACLPFLSRRYVIPLLVVTGAIFAVAALVSIHDPVLETGLPDPVLRALVAAYSLLFFAVLALATWNATTWIWELLDEAAARMRALEESERSLERKVAERTAELSVARDQALAANRAKSSFLAHMSHELRTPLSAIIGYSELLQENAADQRQEQLSSDLSRIVGAGRQLLGLVDDVLDLSRIEAGRVAISVEPFEVAALIAEVADTVKPLLDRNGNRLELAVEPGLGAMRSDAAKVRQILLNLLGNAAKFTSGGTVRIAARRVIEHGAASIELRVSDTGIGMSREQLTRIFESFTQADPSTYVQYGGTGLGLAIVRRSCELLGGEVSAESELGHGSAFRVRLPAQAPSTVQPADGPRA